MPPSPQPEGGGARNERTNTTQDHDADRDNSDPTKPVDAEEDDRDDEDLSPLEFAKRRGLLTGHSNKTLADYMGPPRSKAEKEADFDGEPWSVDLFLPKEKFPMTKGALDLLARTAEYKKAPGLDYFQALARKHRERRCDDLKLELPILERDHDVQMLELMERNRLKFPNFPRDPVTEEDEKKLDWDLPMFRRSRDIIEDGIRNEKFEISAEATELLRKCTERSEMSGLERAKMLSDYIVRLERPLEWGSQCLLTDRRRVAMSECPRPPVRPSYQCPPCRVQLPRRSLCLLWSIPRLPKIAAPLN